MRVKMLKSAKGPELDAPAGREVVLKDDLAKILIARGYAVSLEAEIAETAVEEVVDETAVEDEAVETAVEDEAVETAVEDEAVETAVEDVPETTAKKTAKKKA